MKGDKKVIERLNEALFLELGAVNQYWLHYRLLEDWGYTKLAKKERAESIEEMQHADKLVARIIFLEGHPNLQTVSPCASARTSRKFWKLTLPANMTPAPPTRNRAISVMRPETMSP